MAPIPPAASEMSASQSSGFTSFSTLNPFKKRTRGSPTTSFANGSVTSNKGFNARPRNDDPAFTALDKGRVDRDLLQEDLEYRVTFARRFIGFTPEDGFMLNKASAVITPIIHNIVEGVYNKLFEFDYTKAPFLGRNMGFGGKLAPSLEKLMMDHPQIALRKTFLVKYVRKIFDADFEDLKTWEYLDKVGAMHTGRKGTATLKHMQNKAPIHVDLLACTFLLGWVADVVLTAVYNVPEDVLTSEERLAVIRAFNRLMFIQQDLFQRHYIRDDEEAAFNLAAQAFVDNMGS